MACLHRVEGECEEESCFGSACSYYTPYREDCYDEDEPERDPNLVWNDRADWIDCVWEGFYFEPAEDTPEEYNNQAFYMNLGLYLNWRSHWGGDGLFRFGRVWPLNVKPYWNKFTKQWQTTKLCRAQEEGLAHAAPKGLTPRQFMEWELTKVWSLRFRDLDHALDYWRRHGLIDR